MKTFNEYINEKQHLKLSDFAPEQQTKENEKWIKRHNDTLDRNDKVNTEHPDDGMSIDRDKQDNYETIKDIMKDVEGYVRNYKDSNKIKEILAEKKFIEPLDSKQNQNYDGGTLYSDGRLIYFFWFHKMEYLCRFIVYFHKYLEVFDYNSKNDGKWHMYFDIHGDPLTGVENKSTCWHLEYRCKNGKGEKLETLDKAIDDLYKEISKEENVWGGDLKESKIDEIDFRKLYQDIIRD